LKRSFKGIILVYALVAYAVAIALKYAVQIPTVNQFTSYFGSPSVAVGFYYGLQTVFFEVGLAYLVAWYAVSHSALDARDAEAYGFSLGFWENAVLLGILPLINLISYYAILSQNTQIAQTVYNALMKNASGLFSPASQAIPSVAFGILERVSSIFIHFSWGYLCVAAAYFHKKRYLALALPMGLVDFFVPYASTLGLAGFEALIFALSVLSLIAALYVMRKVRENMEFKPKETKPESI
jgi:hypothetical protein